MLVAVDFARIFPLTPLSKRIILDPNSCHIELRRNAARIEYQFVDISTALAGIIGLPF